MRRLPSHAVEHASTGLDDYLAALVARVAALEAGGAVPQASFTMAPTSGVAPLDVAFTDTSTGEPTSWAWDFGDGATSTLQNPSHTFSEGTHTVTLTASSSYGSTTTSKTLQVDAAATYASQVLAAAPLAYYRLGETSGLTMADSSGNARSGAYENGPTLGAVGLLASDTDSAVDFDGVDSRGSVPSAAWMSVSQFTFEALFAADSLTGNRVIIARHNPEWSTQWGMLRLDGGLPTLYLFSGGWYSCQSPEAVTVAQTYHIAGTFDGTNMRVYVNGTLKATVAAPAPAAKTLPLTVGANDGGLSLEAFDGRIDEVAFYGAALSGSQVAAHYTAATT